MVLVQLLVFSKFVWGTLKIDTELLISMGSTSAVDLPECQDRRTDEEPRETIQFWGALSVSWSHCSALVFPLMNC